MESKRWEIHWEDCITGMAERLEPGSVDLCVTSPPFSNLFQYSGRPEDISNCHDGIDSQASAYGLGMRFFVEQLRRVMAPGSVVCVHVQQLLATKVQHGYMGRRHFLGAIIELFVAGGFIHQSEFVVPKNPQVIAQRQKLHSLMFVTGKRDARDLSPAVNDYVIKFRMPGEGVPVPALYDLQTNPGGWVTTDEWIRDASGIWDDIRETDVLTGVREAREHDTEKHVCPLQLEVVRRCIRLWSNPGALVLDPFSGIGSVGVVALEQGRRYVGFELKGSYFRQSLANMELELQRQQQANTLPLFEAAGMAAP